MFLFFIALDVHQMMTPERRSTAESTRLEIIDMELDIATATAFAISNACKQEMFVIISKTKVGSQGRKSTKTTSYQCVYVYSKTPLLRPPLCLRKNGLYNGVVLILS